MPVIRTAACSCLLVASTVVAACGGGDLPDALVAQATAPLEAGAGLGPFRLATTTLRDFVERVPGGHVSMLFSDDTSVEISFRAAGMSFLFPLPAACAASLGSDARRVVVDLAEPETFFAQHAPCAGAALSSVAVVGTGAPTAYAGASDRGVGLGSTLAEVREREGPEAQVSGVMTANALDQDAATDHHAYPRGIRYSIAEASAGPAKGHLVVTGMAIFPAASP